LALVADDLAAERLVRPFGPDISGHTYHLVTGDGRAPDTPVLAAVDWLRAEVRAFQG